MARLNSTLYVHSSEGSSAAPSLTPIVSHVLETAEAMYGPSDPSYCFYGLTFTCKRGQMIADHHNRRTWIGVPTSYLNNQKALGALLAHECVHVLSPSQRQVSNLEEGAAVHFSAFYTLQYLGIVFPTTNVPYQAATRATRKLFGLDPTILKRLREHQITISDISAKMILKFCPSCPLVLAEFLTARFPKTD
jgi:hypothetical protein